MSLFACPGVGNRPPGMNKFAISGGVPGGGGGPCITSEGDSLIWTLDCMVMSRYTGIV